jgi:hypothetical protein
VKSRLVLITVLLFVGSGASRAQLKAHQSIKDETSVTYMLSHPLHEMEATSKDALFVVFLNPGGNAVDSVTAQVDVMTFDSGNSNRDSHAMEVIDAISFPDVVFSSNGVTRHGDSLVVSGMLTFHGVTKQIVAGMATAWTQDQLQVQGGFTVSLTEFKIDRPSLLMIPVSDSLRFSLKAAFGLK